MALFRNWFGMWQTLHDLNTGLFAYRRVANMIARMFIVVQRYKRHLAVSMFDLLWPEPESHPIVKS